MGTAPDLFMATAGGIPGVKIRARMVIIMASLTPAAPARNHPGRLKIPAMAMIKSGVRAIFIRPGYPVFLFISIPPDSGCSDILTGFLKN